MSLQLSKKTKEAIPKNNSVKYQKSLYNFVIPDLISLPRTRYGGIQSFQLGFPLEFIPMEIGVGMTTLRSL